MARYNDYVKTIQITDSNLIKFTFQVRDPVLYDFGELAEALIEHEEKEASKLREEGCTK